MSKVLGIDLGTTNSCMAIMEGGEVDIILNSEGGRTTPSVVNFEKDGSRIVGQIAKRQLVVSPDRTVSSVKRDMGLNKKYQVDNEEYYPQEISAIILTKLKNDAEAYLGESITDAVITVPAYFNDGQRQATKDAGKIAGLNVLRIINEPTAAALAYGLEKAGNQKMLVYDFGGGTFDISILELTNGMFEVLATNGNNHLGGDDIDNRLINWAVDEFKKLENIDISKDKTAMQRLREASEKAKIELSTMTSTKISLPFISADNNGPKHMDLEITRNQFEKLIKDLVDSSIELMTQTIEDASIKVSEIDKILLVGGTTRVPLVQEAIKVITGKDAYKGINPDECVAQGAAIQGGIICGKVSDLLLLDVTPLSLGIETHGDVFAKLIERNTTIPIRRSRAFSTITDNQSQVEIHVLQGERSTASCNKTLGKFILTDIPVAPRGVPQIEVTFDIDVNGIVHVSAKDLSSGNEQSITIKSSSNLSENDIKKAISDANKYNEEDYRRKELQTIATDAMNVIDLVNTMMDTYSGNITNNQKADFISRIEDLNEMIKLKQYELLSPKIKELRVNMNKVSEGVIAEMAKAASKNEVE